MYTICAFKYFFIHHWSYTSGESSNQSCVFVRLWSLDTNDFSGHLEPKQFFNVFFVFLSLKREFHKWLLGACGAKWQSSASHTVRYEQSLKNKKPRHLNTVQWLVKPAWLLGSIKKHGNIGALCILYHKSRHHFHSVYMQVAFLKCSCDLITPSRYVTYSGP